jgi:hypothetical protein
VYWVIIPVHTVVTNVNAVCKYCGTPFSCGLIHSQFLYHMSKKYLLKYISLVTVLVYIYYDDINETRNRTVGNGLLSA